jgi:hypothetical protein
MREAFQEPQSYPVEVSGWDIAENFFVEETLLDWSTEAIKDIVLHTRVRDGALIFVRLRESGSGSKGIPIAYQAILRDEPSGDDSTHLRLQQLKPGRVRMNSGVPEVKIDGVVRAL